MIDLHTHSNVSDGADTPAEILQKAVQTGLTAVALTDHDTVSGLESFMSAAQNQPILAVPGVEITSMHHYKEVHILGLFIDPESAALKKYLEEIRLDREQRNHQMLERLNIMGFSITEEEVLAKAGGESIGRPHIAQVLVEKGYFPSVNDVFERCLRRGGRAYVQRKPMPPYSSINAIHAAGGLAFWAHPVNAAARVDRSFVRRYLRDMVQQKLDGIELYYPNYGPRHTQVITECAAEYSILFSGGSDYHGEKVRPGIKLGFGDGTLNIPDDLPEKMLKKLGRVL